MSKPMVSVNQNSANNYISAEMNKDLIKQIPSVSSHAIFSIESNWKLVNFIFKHSSSSRRLVSSFRSFDSSKNTKLKANMKIGDKFELQKIIISKSDRSQLVIKRSEISGASSFDFTLLADGPVSSGGGNTPAVASPLFTTASGYTDYYGLTDKRTNTLWSGYVGLSVSTRANVYISPFPAGLTEGSTYKVRFYISQITTPSNDFSLAVAGYGPEVVMSGVDALASYTSKGYVEFNYQIGTSVWGLYIRSSADNQGLCSFTVSKVEIYAI
jgi:hypothetical protein